MKLVSKNSSLFGFVCLAILLGIFVVFLPSSVHSPDPTFLLVDDSVKSEEIPKISHTVVIDGLQKPWDLDFLPDGSLIYNEKQGNVSIFKDGQKKLIHTIPNIFNTGEGGLMGITVDSDFTTNRYIYACYDTSQDIRVSRWKLSVDNSKLEDQKDIITGIPIKSEEFLGRHSGCQVEFAKADKTLWVGTGDVAVGTNPQDPKSLGGKILHVDRDGKAVTGNLEEPFDSRIFNYGHRNIQGIALYDEEKLGSFGYSVEHGSSVDDEVNEIKQGNFGWDPIPGYNESLPMTDLAKFPSAISAVWSSGDTTVATSGADFLKGKNWKIYEGALAIGVQKDKHLMILRFNTKGQVISEQKLFKNDFGRIRSVNTNSLSEVYITTDNGENKDQIIKITAE